MAAAAAEGGAALAVDVVGFVVDDEPAENAVDIAAAVDDAVVVDAVVVVDAADVAVFVDIALVAEYGFVVVAAMADASVADDASDAVGVADVADISDAAGYDFGYVVGVVGAADASVVVVVVDVAEYAAENAVDTYAPNRTHFVVADPWHSYFVPVLCRSHSYQPFVTSYVFSTVAPHISAVPLWRETFYELGPMIEMVVHWPACPYYRHHPLVYYYHRNEPRRCKIWRILCQCLVDTVHCTNWLDLVSD